jgi:hypothetical protein
MGGWLSTSGKPMYIEAGPARRNSLPRFALAHGKLGYLSRGWVAPKYKQQGLRSLFIFSTYPDYCDSILISAWKRLPGITWHNLVLAEVE